MKKQERKKLYVLARHYKNTICINNLRIKQFRLDRKTVEADALDHKMIGIGQYHMDFFDLLRDLNIPYDKLDEEFKGDFEPKTPKMKRSKK